MTTVISVENLSKMYHLGQIGTGTLTNDLKLWWAKARGKPNPLLKIGHENTRHEKAEAMWALNDVSFTVKQGEALGIIGKNGAGKSTLLKILSRITAPTSGKVKVKGRIASLLEVGTGFHPELTGRENIYLNGAILGMSKNEVRRRFEEIVEFAEIPKFIDTPVKRYSSGMYVRLAFAVAAHLEPDILIIDEVLAVGDVAFQQKCLGKMDDVTRQGRTVLFVSHNMPAVTRLCHRGILLEGGCLTYTGHIYDVTNKYLQSDLESPGERCWSRLEHAPGNQVARLKAVRVLSGKQVSETVDIRNSVTVEMDYWNLKADAQLMSAISFINEQGTILFVSVDLQEAQWGSKPHPKGVFRTRCTVPGNLFAEGQVKIAAEVSTRHPVYEIHFLEFDCVSFQVVDKGELGSLRASWGRKMPGVVRPILDWDTDYLGEDNGIFSHKHLS